MLIEIDDSILAYVAASNANRQTAILAFENLAFSHRRGFHVVTGKPRVFKWLLDNLGAGTETKATLLKLFNDSTQTFGLAESFGWYVKAVSPDIGLPRSFESDGRRLSNIPLPAFVDFGICNETVLLAENLDDTSVYKIFGRVYLASSATPMMQIRTDCRAGGGSTTTQVLEGLQSGGGRFCICFVDSDRNCPGGSLGNTAKAVQETYCGDSGLVALHIITVHELENILPVPHLSKMYQANVEKAAACSALIRLGANDPEIIDHIDFKNGLCLKEIFTLPVGSPAHEFWHSKLPVLTSTEITGRTYEVNCSSDLNCTYSEECKCVVVGSLGGEVLSDFLSSISEHSNEKLAKLFKGCPEVSRLGKAILESCCGTAGVIV